MSNYILKHRIKEIAEDGWKYADWWVKVENYVGKTSKKIFNTCHISFKTNVDLNKYDGLKIKDETQKYSLKIIYKKYDLIFLTDADIFIIPDSIRDAISDEYIGFFKFIFDRVINVTSIDFTNTNVNNMCDLSHMFYNDTELTKITGIGNEFPNAKNMENMFWNCNALKTLNCQEWKITKIENASTIFNESHSKGIYVKDVICNNDFIFFKNDKLFIDPYHDQLEMNGVFFCLDKNIETLRNIKIGDTKENIFNKYPAAEIIETKDYIILPGTTKDFIKSNKSAKEIIQYKKKENVFTNILTFYIDEKNKVINITYNRCIIDDYYCLHHKYEDAFCKKYDRLWEKVKLKLKKDSFYIDSFEYLKFNVNVALDKISGYEISDSYQLHKMKVSIKDKILIFNTDASEFVLPEIFEENRSFFMGRNFKNIDLTNVNFSYMRNISGLFAGCENLENIDVEKLNIQNTVNMSSVFSGCKNITKLKFNNIDTSRVTNMSYMFAGCESLKKIDISSFDTSKVIRMTGMFECCKLLTEIELSNFNTERVVYFCRMFYGCNKILNLNVLSFNTSNAKDMTGMFCDCFALEKLDISKFKINNKVKVENMLSGCDKLKNIDISNFDIIDKAKKKMFSNKRNIDFYVRG